MNSWWEAYHCTGLMILEDEAEGFSRRYLEKHPDVAAEDLEEWMETQEELTGSNGVPFQLIRVCEDNSTGARFWPLCEASEGKDGMSGLWHGYILPSEKVLDSALALREKPYRDYEELKAELIEKVRGYLPDDFPWDDRIGVMDYAIYA